MQASKGGRRPTVLSGFYAFKPHQWPAWYHNSMGIVVAHVPWTCTDNSVIKHKSCSIRRKSCLWLETNTPTWGGEIMGPRKKIYIQRFSKPSVIPSGIWKICSYTLRWLQSSLIIKEIILCKIWRPLKAKVLEPSSIEYICNTTSIPKIWVAFVGGDRKIIRVRRSENLVWDCVF